MTNDIYHYSMPTCHPRGAALVCPKDGVVLDPFCGSGSTGVACMREQMRFVGIDQEPEYCKIAERRIREECERGVQLNLF